MVVVGMSILVDGILENLKGSTRKKLGAAPGQGTYYVFVKFVEEGDFKDLFIQLPSFRLQGSRWSCRSNICSAPANIWRTWCTGCTRANKAE